MAIRKYKPTTPGLRGSSVADFAEITRSTPEKSLLRPLHKTGGRNNTGRITTRHKGGGHKRQYRLVDFRRHDKDGVPATVAHIEYDPNRTARIALLHYADGEKRYILAPNKLTQGTVIENGPSADIKPGNAMPFSALPIGTIVHNVEMKAGKGGQIARAAGTYAQFVGRDGGYAQIRDPGQAPLAQAAGYMVRQRVTGRPLPAGAQNVLDLWRDTLESQAGGTLGRIEAVLAD